MADTLRGAANIYIANFKADILQVQSTMPLDQAVSTSHPLAVRLMSQLEVLHSWAGMVARLLERLESRSYDHFDVIIRSDALANVLVALIALTAN